MNKKTWIIIAIVVAIAIIAYIVYTKIVKTDTRQVGGNRSVGSLEQVQKGIAELAVAKYATGSRELVCLSNPNRIEILSDLDQRNLYSALSRDSESEIQNYLNIIRC